MSKYHVTVGGETAVFATAERATLNYVRAARRGLPCMLSLADGRILCLANGMAGSIDQDAVNDLEDLVPRQAHLLDGQH